MPFCGVSANFAALQNSNMWTQLVAKWYCRRNLKYHPQKENRFTPSVIQIRIPKKTGQRPYGNTQLSPQH
jgi:hypothetical protein